MQPDNNWCDATFDGRFRPYNLLTLTGPKDVIIVIDT